MATIQHQIFVRAKPMSIFAAVGHEDGLRAWWTSDADVDEAEGGNAEFRFLGGKVTFRMTITKLVPYELVEWQCHGNDPDWQGTTLTWRIRADGEGTTLQFDHANWREADEHFASSNTTWGMLMYYLKDHLEGKNLDPYWK